MLRGRDKKKVKIHCGILIFKRVLCLIGNVASDASSRPQPPLPSKKIVFHAPSFSSLPLFHFGLHPYSPPSPPFTLSSTLILFHSLWASPLFTPSFSTLGSTFIPHPLRFELHLYPTSPLLWAPPSFTLPPFHFMGEGGTNLSERLTG